MSEPTQEVKVDHKTVYHPTQDVIKRARISDWDALSKAAGEDPQAFWAERAGELEWYQPWDKVLDDSERALLQVVRRRQDQHRRTTRSTAT